MPGQLEGAAHVAQCLVQIGLVLVAVLGSGTRGTTVRAGEDPRTAVPFLQELTTTVCTTRRSTSSTSSAPMPGCRPNLKVVLDYQEGRTEIDEAARTGDLAHRRDLLRAGAHEARELRQGAAQPSPGP